MKTTTIEDRRGELRARHESELAKLNAESSILESLPASLPAPTISNIDSKSHTRAWLSFHPDYGTDAKAFALSIFAELEKAYSRLGLPAVYIYERKKGASR